jgi:hypothetical protein
MSPAGPVLAFGGTSNWHEKASIVIVSDDGEAARFPAEGPRLECDGCPERLPRRVILFPRGELTGANYERFNFVRSLRQAGPSLKGIIDDGSGSTVLMLSPDFSVESLEFTDRYWAAHREFELRGRIEHPADACPDRTAPREVREWTPEGLWRVSILKTDTPSLFRTSSRTRSTR